MNFNVNIIFSGSTPGNKNISFINQFLNNRSYRYSYNFCVTVIECGSCIFCNAYVYRVRYTWNYKSTGWTNQFCLLALLRSWFCQLLLYYDWNVRSTVRNAHEWECILTEVLFLEEEVRTTSAGILHSSLPPSPSSCSLDLTFVDDGLINWS